MKGKNERSLIVQLTLENSATTSNVTFVRPAKFYLSGFSNIPHVTYFYIFLLIYLVRTLHTPKYMIVFNLALADLCGSTALTPKVFETFLFDRTDIVFEDCLSYMFFVYFFTDVQAWILVIMAYDRFIAICFPLRYHSIYNIELVRLLDCLSFCGSLVIQSIFCDHGPIYHLAYHDKSLNYIFIFIFVLTVFSFPLILICLTYVCIAIALTRIATAKERVKALKTCTSHLILVAIFYLPFLGTNIAVVTSYLHPNARIINSTLTHTIPALLNPIIYSLKTEEVLNSIKKLYENNNKGTSL
uniref:G-protein coupled receptors family 1 profile domain-containing protein n=1 Tax=Mastacembelus armatus TaxID=205130 RepID=A0A3Q3MLU9_9TELE